MAGRTKRTTALAILGILAVGGLVGCGGGSDDDGATTTSSDRAFTPAAAPSALKEAGSEIADGVHVQPGSALVGTAFPVVDPFDETAGASGWQAVIAVQDDPIEVWEAYAAQLGINDVAGAREACIVGAPAEVSDDASKHQRFLTEPVLDGEVRLECSARVGDVTASLVSGAVGCVRPNVSDDPCELRSGSSLYLRKAPDGDRSSAADPALGTDELRVGRAPIEPGQQRHPGPVDIPKGPIVAPELQGAGPSNLPGAGERIDDGIDDYLGTDGYDAPPAMLPTGAESLIAPAMLIDCNSGLVAAVSLPLAPADAVAVFATDDPEGTTDVRSGTWSGRAWATRFFDSAGGYKLQLTAVAGDEDASSYVLATECGD